MTEHRPGGVLAALGALGAALLASSCCIGPLALAVLGATGAGFAAALTPYRPWFLGLTFLLLGGAFYTTYRKRPAEDCCAEDAACAARSQRRNKRFLWILTVLVLTSAAYPRLATFTFRDRAPRTTDAAARAATDRGGGRVTFAVEGMTCESCARHIERELAHVPGVNRALVHFSDRQAVVEWTGRKPTRQALTAAVEKAGYEARFPAPPNQKKD